jgi:hypothetical protein
LATVALESLRVAGSGQTSGRRAEQQWLKVVVQWAQLGFIDS